MLIERRTFCAGSLAASLIAAAPGLAAANSGRATRRFDLVRAGDKIGWQTFAVSREGDEVSVHIQAEIVVRLAGIAVYRYELDSREVWRDGRLASLDAKTNDDGTPEFAKARRDGDVLNVEGSGFTGVVEGDPATTTYWTPEFLKRSTWISTQDGKPLAITARRVGEESFPTPDGEVEATRWSITGDLDDLDLFYDGAQELIGIEFPARGETARFSALERRPALTPLWVQAS